MAVALCAGAGASWRSGMRALAPGSSGAILASVAVCHVVRVFNAFVVVASMRGGRGWVPAWAKKGGL